MMIATGCGIVALLMCSVTFGWGRKPVDEASVAQQVSAVPVGVKSMATEGEPPSDVPTYPATVFGSRIIGALADSLYALSGGGYARDADRDLVGNLDGKLQVQWWWASSQQSFLDTLLPGARFLHEQWYRMGSYGGFVRSNRVMFRGQLYDFAGLNRLLHDAGFQFSESSMVRVARAAVLLSVFSRGADSVGRLVPNEEEEGLVPGPHAFPSVRILDVKVTPTGTRGLPGWGRDVLLDCIIDGVRLKARVTFLGSERSTLQPFVVWLNGAVIMQLRPIPSSELQGEN